MMTVIVSSKKVAKTSTRGGNSGSTCNTFSGSGALAATCNGWTNYDPSIGPTRPARPSPPSTFLPHGEGLFRFGTVAQAAEATEAINADYERHGRAARELAETDFDAKKVVTQLLDAALA